MTATTRLPSRRSGAGLLGLGLVAALATLVLPRAASAVTRAPGPLAPAQGALFGAHPKTGSSDDAQRAGLESLETKLGRTLAIDHYYKPWTNTFPTWREQWDFDNGRIPMISWGKTYASDINRGQHDELIRTRGAAVAALGQPLFLRRFWEMDGNRNLQYSQSPAEYIAAWQRIRNIFVEQGATNAVFVWCPNASGFTTGDAQEYYPGDDYVDWTCADAYDWYTRPGDADPSFENLFRDFYDWASARPKPIMVGEYGVLESTSPADHKPAWVDAAHDALENDFTAVAAVVYFNSSGDDNNGVFRDWRVDSSTASLAAFQAMGSDPYFHGGPVTVDTTGPTVTDIAPADGATDVAVDAAISATFSEALDPATVTVSTVTLTTGGDSDPIAVPVSLDYTAATHSLSLAPTSPLQAGVEHRARVKGGSGGVADVLGNPMAADREWRFATAVPAPVPHTRIDSGPEGVVASTTAAFTFSSDQSGAAFECRLDGAGFGTCLSPVAFSSLADGPHTFEVRAWTTAGGTDPGPADRTWSVDATAPVVTRIAPADGAVDVPASAVARVSFSESVDPATVTPAAFTLTGGAAGAVAGNVGYDAGTRTAWFSPVAPLQGGAAYTVTVKGGPAGVADAVGNRLVADRVWRFTVFLPAPVATSFAPMADARVEEAHPKNNYGGSSRLSAKGGSGPDVQSYLRFGVNGLSGTVQSAKLRLYVSGGTADGPALYTTTSGWLERGTGAITWKNRPGPSGGVLGDKSRLAANSWVEYDVTSLVKGNGTYNVVLVGKAKDALEVYSRERSAKRPELVVTTR